MHTSATTEIKPLEARLFNYPVHLLSVKEGIERIETTLQRDAGENLHVVTLNPEMIMQADQDAELARILQAAGLVIPDGAGIVWALKMNGYKTQRLPGIELSEALLRRAAERQYRVAIVGAAPEVLPQAIESLMERYPGLNVMYSHHGYFSSPAQEAEVAQACAASQPQIVLVALGVPRQEKWIAKYGPLFKGAVLIGVGGSLDVWSGKSNRAPALMRQLNLEWLYRISKEPWRIRRIYKALPMFVVKVLVNR